MQQSIQTPARSTKLFGTDGIRAKAGIYPLDQTTLVKIAKAITRTFTERTGSQPRFIIGRDTRESGEMIENTFISVIRNSGGQCTSAGVITTPGVAFLTSKLGYDAGIVISASHNPYSDNGIKVFLPNGRKMGEELERAIESDVANSEDIKTETDMFSAVADPGFHDLYLAYISDKFAGLELKGKRIVIDCANGAASDLAPRLFKGYGAETVVINNSPDGKNINENCGSLHLEKVREEVLRQKADIGIAFDGDADRALFVDESGNVVDGDGALWILAIDLLNSGQLSSPKVVATVMSNVGLEIALQSNGIDLVRTDVGDKYVLEELLKNGGDIGGEQSGHLIFPKYGLVGDGMVTASAILSAKSVSDKSLSELTEGFVKFPQITYNVKVSEKTPFEEIPEIVESVAQVEESLAGRGRLLLRYSGTEKLARIMIEGEDQDNIDALAVSLGEVIRKNLG